MVVTNTVKTKTCGREPTCELNLEHPSVSRIHAHIELAVDGQICVRDDTSRNGTFLNRNDVWIQVKKAILCIGDRIRFGDVEVPLEQVTALFGNRANTRLEARHFALGHGSKSYAKQLDHGTLLKKPRRNPATGKIEEERPA